MPLSITTKKRIYIEKKPHLCRSSQFSSEFPQELNGIITPEEFHQSITNINQAYRKTFWETFFIFVTLLCIIVGIILLSILAAPTIQDNAFIPVLVVGLVLSWIGFCSCICTTSIIDRSRQARLKKVLADESMKYSMRLMLPFTWRLERHRIPPIPYEDGATIIEKLVIEIGPRTDSEMRNNTLNFNSAEPTSYIGQQSRILSPSYS